jgi:hypothetical protein
VSDVKTNRGACVPFGEARTLRRGLTSSYWAWRIDAAHRGRSPGPRGIRADDRYQSPGAPPALLHRSALSQLGARSHTVASYRDTFKLLLAFASKRLATPFRLRIEDLDAALLGDFLDDLEQKPANTAKRATPA